MIYGDKELAVKILPDEIHYLSGSYARVIGSGRSQLLQEH